MLKSIEYIYLTYISLGMANRRFKNKNQKDNIKQVHQLWYLIRLV